MALTKADLQDIRGIVVDAIDTAVPPAVDKAVGIAVRKEVDYSITTNVVPLIRQVVREEIAPLRGDIKAHGEDIKELYGMFDRLREALWLDKDFKRIPPLRQRTAVLNRRAKHT